MLNINPCLWFDGQAEEAAEFYVSIFPRSKIVTVTHYEEAGAKASGQPEGSVMTVLFELLGQEFLGLNGGPQFSFSPAISLMVNCDTQAEIDELWAKLSEGGEPGQCGWLTDKYGVSWQIVPTGLGEMFKDADAAATQRIMRAVIQMGKLDMATLKRAKAAGGARR